MNFQSLVELAPWTTIAQICNLLIQIVLFKKFLFQPIKNIIAKRQAEVDGLYDEAGKAKADAEEAKAAYETHLKTASEEAKAITTRAISSANLASEQIVSTAKAEADAMPFLVPSFCLANSNTFGLVFPAPASSQVSIPVKPCHMPLRISAAFAISLSVAVAIINFTPFSFRRFTKA